MNGLLSSASPWQNDSNQSSTSKKRTPSFSIPRNNKTIKKNTKINSSDMDIYINEEEEPDFSNSNFKESFQPLQPNTIESIQQENENRMSRVQQLINNVDTENDGQHLANFKPIAYSSIGSSSSTAATAAATANPNTIRPLYSMNNSETSSNPYSSYHDIYLGDLKIGNYKEKTTKDSSSERIIEKLNRMLHILEEQQFEPTKHITEEFILYTFLGVFVIYIVDSFTRAGKYIR